MSAPMVVATIALQGATVGVSGELAIRSLFRKRDKAASVRIGKFFLGLSMAIKSILFLSYHTSLGNNCYVVGRLADFFYHLAMTAGTHVLVTRVQSIVPIEWRRRAIYFHSSITILRFIIGVVDVVVVQLDFYADGTCLYVDQEYWGPVYTLYDTVVDLYVTIMISFILISHIRSLLADRMKVNKILYTSVIYHNVTRTFCLTIANLVSAIFIITRDEVGVIMLLWPIINILFVILVGYDSDVTKAIRKLSQKRWRTLSNMTSTIDLGGIPSIITTSTPNVNSRPTLPNLKRPISHHRSDPEMSMFDSEVINSRPNSDINECNEYTDSYDLSMMHIEKWKSKHSATEQQIQEQAGYDEEKEGETRRKSLPDSQHHPRPSASYDTDHTLT